MAQSSTDTEAQALVSLLSELEGGKEALHSLVQAATRSDQDVHGTKVNSETPSCKAPGPAVASRAAVCSAPQAWRSSTPGLGSSHRPRR